MSAELEEQAGRVLEALSDADGEALARLVSPDIKIDTGRTILEGVEAASGWASKRYDHLDRHYIAEHTKVTGDGVVVVSGLTRYFWREEGTDAAQDTPVCFELRFEDGLLVHMRRED